MMTEEQTSLWERLSAFEIDVPDAVLPFSHRLARENRWSLTFTRRVMAEYKRFLFLAVVAGHPISPSHSVDQVWHLHLTYSKSYWNDLCRDILQRPFHHEPTQGGAAETEKFNDWYANTLASYCEFFHQDPPADIWPASVEHSHDAWVDLHSNWVIPRPKWFPRIPGW